MFQTLAYYSSVFHKEFVGYTSDKLQKLGINFGSVFFLIYVGNHPGCTPSELTKALQMDWGHSQRSVTKMVNEGFMTKDKCGRIYHLNLTEKGQQAFQVSHQVFFDWDKEKLKALTDAECRQLFELLQKAAMGKKDVKAN